MTDFLTSLIPQIVVGFATILFYYWDPAVALAFIAILMTGFAIQILGKLDGDRS